MNFKSSEIHSIDKYIEATEENIKKICESMEEDPGCF